MVPLKILPFFFSSFCWPIQCSHSDHSLSTTVSLDSISRMPYFNLFSVENNRSLTITTKWNNEITFNAMKWEIRVFPNASHSIHRIRILFWNAGTMNIIESLIDSGAWSVAKRRPYLKYAQNDWRKKDWFKFESFAWINDILISQWNQCIQNKGNWIGSTERSAHENS